MLPGIARQDGGQGSLSGRADAAAALAERRLEVVRRALGTYRLRVATIVAQRLLHASRRAPEGRALRARVRATFRHWRAVGRRILVYADGFPVRGDRPATASADDTPRLRDPHDVPRRPHGRGAVAASRAARHLLAEGLHPADDAVPRRLRLLHVRAAAATRRARLPAGRRGARDRPGRSRRRLHRGAVHARRQARAALPGRA